MNDLLDQVESTVDSLPAAGCDMAPIREHLARSVGTLRRATQWMTAADHTDALAGATPYQRLFAVVLGGWLMARQVLGATARLADAPPEQRAFLEAKVVTGRFFCTQLLPQADGLFPAIVAGANDLVGLSADQF